MTARGSFNHVPVRSTFAIENLYVGIRWEIGKFMGISSHGWVNLAFYVSIYRSQRRRRGLGRGGPSGYIYICLPFYVLYPNTKHHIIAAGFNDHPRTNHDVTEASLHWRRNSLPSLIPKTWSAIIPPNSPNAIGVCCRLFAEVQISSISGLLQVVSESAGFFFICLFFRHSYRLTWFDLQATAGSTALHCAEAIVDENIGLKIYTFPARKYGAWVRDGYSKKYFIIC